MKIFEMYQKLSKLVFMCLWITICAREIQQKCDDLLCKNNECVSGKNCDGKVDCKDGSDETTGRCAFLRCTSDSFRCSYGACVNSTARCNGVQDCADNSDEIAANCPVPSVKLSLSENCPRNKFKCSSGECIPIISACDGEKDCADGSDETNTACASNFCPEFAFRCDYGACLARDAQCDGILDCADGSDENVAQCNPGHITSNPAKLHVEDKPTDKENIPEGGCKLEYIKDVIIAFEATPDVHLESGQYAENYQSVIYKCPAGYISEGPKKNWCIQGKWARDRQPRCAQIQQKCDDLLCKNNDCVSGKDCDGKVDCGDGSDETTERCAFLQCSNDSFRCTYGACVNSTAQCNGVQDCADNSDEIEATCLAPREKLPQSENCSRNKFKCSSGECIPIISACDGEKNCADGSDETNAACASNFCPEFAFRCDYGACLARDAQCDGILDCADGSDESVSHCNPGHTTSNPAKLHVEHKPTDRENIPEGGCKLEYIKDVIIAFEGNPDVHLESEQYAENYQSVIYKCPAGYILKGPEKNWCIQGKWARDRQPRCENKLFI